MMALTKVYTFPFSSPIRKPLCTLLHTGAEGLFGFAIQAGAHSPEHGSYSFFQVDVERNTVSHVSTSSLPTRFGSRIHLAYDFALSRWVLGIAGPQELLEVYEVQQGSNQPWNKLTLIENQKVQLGDRILVGFWQQNQHYPLIYAIPDIGEVSDAQLYWTQWRSVEEVSHEFPFQLGYCDTAVPYITNEGCLLFLCQRFFKQEPEDPGLRRGPGDWHLAIAAYHSNGALIHEEDYSKVTYPIHDLKLPENDFFNWLHLTICVSEGPFIGSEKQHTCVAVLLLRDLTATSQTEASKGGLYWVDLQGHLLGQAISPLGTQISLCHCGDTVIGTDNFEGQRRLWSWSPSSGTALRVVASLSSEAFRTTVVSQERQESSPSVYFWSIEEFQEGLLVSRWASHSLQKLETIWCDGITLMDDLIAPYLRDRQPKGIVAYRDTLLIVGIDKEKYLTLFQVR